MVKRIFEVKTLRKDRLGKEGCPQALGLAFRPFQRIGGRPRPSLASFTINMPELEFLARRMNLGTRQLGGESTIREVASGPEARRLLALGAQHPNILEKSAPRRWRQTARYKTGAR